MLWPVETSSFIMPICARIKSALLYPHSFRICRSQGDLVLLSGGCRDRAGSSSGGMGKARSRTSGFLSWHAKTKIYEKDGQ